jgi:hypothetical protein
MSLVVVIVEPVGDNVGERGGGGATTMIAGGEVVSLSSSSREGDEGGWVCFRLWGCLGRRKDERSRNRESRFLNSYNNQPKDGVRGRGLLEMACDLGGMCRGGVLALFGVANRLKKKIKI